MLTAGRRFESYGTRVGETVAAAGRAAVAGGETVWPALRLLGDNSRVLWHELRIAFFPCTSGIKLRLMDCLKMPLQRSRGYLVPEVRPGVDVEWIRQDDFDEVRRMPPRGGRGVAALPPDCHPLIVVAGVLA